MLEAIAAGTGGLPVIFPVHPRRAKTLQTLPGFPPSLRLVAEMWDGKSGERIVATLERLLAT